MNEIENRKTLEKNNETTSWFFGINTTDKLLANLIRKNVRKDTNYQYKE